MERANTNYVGQAGYNKTYEMGKRNMRKRMKKKFEKQQTLQQMNEPIEIAKHLIATIEAKGLNTNAMTVSDMKSMWINHFTDNEVFSISTTRWEIKEREGEVKVSILD
jgi:hypothetical protein